MFLNNLEGVIVDDKNFRLTKNLYFASGVMKRDIAVPAGFETDFASVPRLPMLYSSVGNIGHHAAVLHDYIYRTVDMPDRPTREQADDVFREALALNPNISGWQRWLMYSGVRMFGGSSYKV